MPFWKVFCTVFFEKVYKVLLLGHLIFGQNRAVFGAIFSGYCKMVVIMFQVSAPYCF